MTSGSSPTERFVHATALLIGECGLLIRGAAGSGKSSLAAALCNDARHDGRFARLIGDDRVSLAVRNERLVARPHPAIAGLLERRMLGLCPVPHEAACLIRLVIDLATEPPPRFPDDNELVKVEGVALPRIILPARPDEAARRLVFVRIDAGFLVTIV